MKLWLFISGILAWVGMCLSALTPHAHAWSGERGLAMHRGLVAHTLFNKGMSGRQDNVGKQPWSSFSYPQGRSLLVYSGGAERDWNSRSNTGGEGVWVMSHTGGVPHVSAAGSEVVTRDVLGVGHDPSRDPEAYVGVVHDEEYALASRKRNGREAEWTQGVNLFSVATNWWPGSGGVNPAQAPPAAYPVVIWNYRYGGYCSGQRFADLVADRRLDPLAPPVWAEVLSEDDFPEVIGISKAKSKDTGLQWTRKWYQWGHADYDDFLVNETVVENTSSSSVQGVYVVFQNRFWQQNAGGWRGGTGLRNNPEDWSRDDHARSTMAANYLDGVSRQAFLAGEGKPAGLPLGAALAEQGHAMLYAHDGESRHITNPHLDVGDPYRRENAAERFNLEQTWIKEGYLNHSQYFGIGVVDAFPPFNTYGGIDPETYVSPYDNPDTPHDESRQQPASVTMWRFTSVSDFAHPSPLRDTDTYIYDTLTRAGYHDEAEEAYSYSHLMAFGPYDLAPGQKAKVVVAYVGGTGADDAKYSDYRRYPQPLTFAWMNLSGGTDRPYVTFEERQQEIPLGEDAMFRHFQRAINVYNWGYDVPNEPPSIRLAFESNLDGQMVIRWSAHGEDSPDPDYEGEEAVDLRGYRIYRSKTENQGPWEFVTAFSLEDARSGKLLPRVTYDPNGVFRTVADQAFPEGIPLRESRYHSGMDAAAGAEVRGVYTYTDREVMAGYPYWYSVRYYDSGHADWKGQGSVPSLESAPGPSGGATLGKTFGVVPVVPGADVFNRFEAKVAVVPNPYMLGDEQHSYKGQENIRFINLPGRCLVDIYDVTGQRVWTFGKDDLNKGEATWFQMTENRLTPEGEAMFPGIYFYKVTSLMPESMWQTQTGTFLVIK